MFLIPLEVITNAPISRISYYSYINDILSPMIVDKVLGNQVSGDRSLEDRQIARLLDLQAHHQIGRTCCDLASHGLEVLGVGHLQSPRDLALLAIRLDQGCSLFECLLYPQEDRSERIHDLDTLQDEDMADHKVDTLHQILAFLVDFASFLFNVDDDLI